MMSNLEVIVFGSSWMFFLALICFAQIWSALILFSKIIFSWPGIFFEEGVVGEVILIISEG